MEIDTLLGERIAHARRAKGLSQKQLADLVGVTKSTVAKWESDRTSPRANRLNQVAGLLGIPMAWLLGGVDTPATVDTPSLNETSILENKLEAMDALLRQMQEIVEDIRGQSRMIQDEFDAD